MRKLNTKKHTLNKHFIQKKAVHLQLEKQTTKFHISTKMTLPSEFTEYTSKLFGEQRWQQYLASFNEDTPVSIRLNPLKAEGKKTVFQLATAVPWCKYGYYLSERPNFTLDPLLHAGAYYVQEASSMFLDEVIRQHFHDNSGAALDLCAAPGGKSTLLRAALPEGITLYSNEPDRRRANILSENMQKEGLPNVVVTNNLPRDYKRSKMAFDLILCDVPCSGEGMFRKDAGAIGEWSVQNVMKCRDLQRSIVEDIWPCLKPGAILVYSTCTFNTHENEENVRWITEELGAELLPVNIREEWNITGSLLADWHGDVYRFIPGITNGEGLFMAVMRKTDGEVFKNPKPQLNILHSSLSIPQGTQKGKDVIPAHAEALMTNLQRDKYPMTELSQDDALRYLRREAIVLPDDTPRGFVIVTYQGLPLGFVKNIGNRANNLYPQEWRIRNL